MAGVSSVGGSSGIYSMFQKLRGGSSAGTETAGSQSVAGAPDPAKLKELRGKLESAVEGAVQGLDADAGPEETMQAVQGAVEKTLQENGIDPAQFKKQMQAMGGPPPGFGGGPPGMGSYAEFNSAGSQSQKTDLFSLFSGDEDESEQTDAAAVQQPSSQPNGLDESRQFNLSQFYAQMFRNFPNGTGVDVAA